MAALAQTGALPPLENEEAKSPPAIEIKASSADMFALADGALARGDEPFAVRILRTLIEDRDRSVRNEARFRLAALAARKKDWVEAGTYLRAILDEEPDAQRVRLELARVQAELGQIDAARRTLRAAQSGGLPLEVARTVDRFAVALRESKPFGASVRMALAPDSNINRATRSDTLGTVIGDFALDDDARQTSGLGLSLGAETYLRRPLDERTSILARAGFSGDLYRSARFSDVVALASIGPEFSIAGGRASALAGGHIRWFGGTRYAHAYDADLRWQRALGGRAQLRTNLGYSRYRFERNRLQNSHALTAAVSIERALGRQGGIAATLGGARVLAAEPAYSSASGQASVTGWLDAGRMTLFAAGAYQRLENDRRLAIYPEKRKDDFLRASVGATLRSFTWRGWAPQVKLTWERNRSTIEVYDYQRWRSELGVARSF